MTPLQAALVRAVKFLLRRAAEQDEEHRPDSHPCPCAACRRIRDIEMEE